MDRLANLIHRVRPALRWQWYHAPTGRKRLQLLTPRGIVWDFKLSGGAFIRKTTLKLTQNK